MAVIFDTDEMKTLYKKFNPYLDARLELSDDAPEDVKEALAEYIRLGKKQDALEISM